MEGLVSWKSGKNTTKKSWKSGRKHLYLPWKNGNDAAC
jgi:hypothetical protein